MTHRLLATLSVLLAIALAGCAQVPKESVQLSATLGRDLQEVQRSHRKAVDLLFERDIERVNRYLDDVAMPTYVKFAIDGTGAVLQRDLAAATAPGASQEAKDKLFDDMRKIVQGVTARLAKQKKELVDPIEASRKSTLEELDMAYAQMQKANAVLTAHLASIVKVHDVQDELLAKAGLKDFREKVGTEALTANDKIEKVLAQAKDVEQTITDLKAAVAKLKK